MSRDGDVINSSNIKKLKKGDFVAFEKIYNALSGRLFYFVNSSILNQQDAEEIVQEVFITIWNKREDIESVSTFQSYIYTIAKNKINDHLRKVLQEKKYIESVIADYHLETNDLEEIISYRDTNEVLNKLINLLPEKRKRVFELSRFSGMTYKEISAEMNISENTVDTQMRKALLFLREGMLKLSTIILFLILN